MISWTRNDVLHTWLDLDADPASEGFAAYSSELTEADTPVIACGRKVILKNPSNRQLAERLGLRKLEPKVYDLVVVGAGPASWIIGRRAMRASTSGRKAPWFWRRPACTVGRPGGACGSRTTSASR